MLKSMPADKIEDCSEVFGCWEQVHSRKGNPVVHQVCFLNLFCIDAVVASMIWLAR